MKKFQVLVVLLIVLLTVDAGLAQDATATAEAGSSADMCLPEGAPSAASDEIAMVTITVNGELASYAGYYKVFNHMAVSGLCVVDGWFTIASEGYEPDFDRATLFRILIHLGSGSLSFNDDALLDLYGLGSTDYSSPDILYGVFASDTGLQIGSISTNKVSFDVSRPQVSVKFEAVGYEPPVDEQ